MVLDSKIPFYKKPRSLVIFVLAVVLLAVIIAASINYLHANKARVEFTQAQLFDNGNTLILDSAKFKGSFWNFARSDIYKETTYVPESAKDYVLVRSESGWMLEQEVSADILASGINSSDQETSAQVRLMEGDFSLWELTYSGGKNNELVTMHKEGSSWSLQQNLSETIPELSCPLSFFLRDIHYSAELDVILVQQCKGSADSSYHVLRLNGLTWELSRTVSIKGLVTGVDDGYTYLRGLDGNTLLISAEQGGVSILHILQWDGEDWRHETEISAVQLLSDSPDAEFTRLWVQGDTLLFTLYASPHERIYIFRYNGSAWELEQEISEDKPVKGLNYDFGSLCGPGVADFDRDSLLIMYGRASYILRRSGSAWELEQEISEERLVQGVNSEESSSGLTGCNASWDIRDLNGDTLILGDEDKGLLYILERNGQRWELAQKIEGEI